MALIIFYLFKFPDDLRRKVIDFTRRRIAVFLYYLLKYHTDL